MAKFGINKLIEDINQQTSIDWWSKKPLSKDLRKRAAINPNLMQMSIPQLRLQLAKISMNTPNSD